MQIGKINYFTYFRHTELYVYVHRSVFRVMSLNVPVDAMIKAWVYKLAGRNKPTLGRRPAARKNEPDRSPQTDDHYTHIYTKHKLFVHRIAYKDFKNFHHPKSDCT